MFFNFRTASHEYRTAKIGVWETGMEVVLLRSYLLRSRMKNITVVITRRKFEVISERNNLYGICINIR